MKSIAKDLAEVGVPVKDLAQVAWNFINDSLRTTIALHVHSRPPPPRRAAHSPPLHVASPLTLPLAPGPPPITANTYLLHSIRRNVWRRQRSAWRHASWAWRFLPGTRL